MTKFCSRCFKFINFTRKHKHKHKHSKGKRKSYKHRFANKKHNYIKRGGTSCPTYGINTNVVTPALSALANPIPISRV
jgi:hypothetical protein